jgi:nucleotide-binding universal stress UspA family protein
MYKKCLVPLDGSELAECALNHAEKLVREGLVNELTVFNVVTIDIPWADLQNTYVDFSMIREPLIAAAKKYLAEVKSRLASEGITVKTEWAEGIRPASVITDYARKNGIDLIVIATHGYTGMKKLLLGGVAFGVLHESYCPVLLIRPESCRP